MISIPKENAAYRCQKNEVRKMATAAVALGGADGPSKKNLGIVSSFFYLQPSMPLCPTRLTKECVSGTEQKRRAETAQKWIGLHFQLTAPPL